MQVDGNFKVRIGEVTYTAKMHDCGHTKFKPGKGPGGPKKYRAEINLGKSQNQQSGEGSSPREAMNALAHTVNGTVVACTVS